jgi:winged helix DNA-binding protein
MPELARRSDGDILSQRALNRATLARQMLLRRHETPILKALEHLVGLQAQAADPPYIGLWTRLEGFAFKDLSRLMIERKVVRTALMRGTLHIVAARDVLKLRPALQPVFERTLIANHGRDLVGLDLGAVTAAARDILEVEPLTYAALGKALQKHWTERKAEALAVVARNGLALVQAPPALWDGGKLTRMTTAEKWLGKPLDTKTAPAELVLRYLAAFGPASVADIRAWCGLAGMAEIVATLRPRLRRFRSEAGVELFDLEAAPRSDPDIEAPARLLPGFDNLILSHADRTRFLAEEHRSRIATSNGIFHPTLLVDGRIAGTWKTMRSKRETSIEMAPFARLGADQRRALRDEASALLKAVGADGDHVRFARA